MTASDDILADLGLALGYANRSDVERAHSLALHTDKQFEDGGVIRADDMIELVGCSDLTLHKETSLRDALQLLGCREAGEIRSAPKH